MGLVEHRWSEEQKWNIEQRGLSGEKGKKVGQKRDLKEGQLILSIFEFFHFQNKYILNA